MTWVHLSVGSDRGGQPVHTWDPTRHTVIEPVRACLHLGVNRP